MTDETLTRIVQHAVGVVGYFDCEVTAARQESDRVVVEWDHYGRRAELLFTLDGDPIR